jgi:hypothetical protein
MKFWFQPSTRELPFGVIFRIACDAGIDVPPKGSKRPIKCPFHDDKHASAFLSEQNIFFCSCCSPDGGWPAKRFAEALKLDWSRYIRELRPTSLPVTPMPPPPTFSAGDAQQTWARAFARARDDESVDQDRAVYDYLHQRGLAEAFEHGVFGVLGPDKDLHRALSSWYGRGYRLLVPLFDQQGVIANIQARAIRDVTPKTMLPAGARVSGTVFADRRGQALLGGEDASQHVILGEGLTDTLALSAASPIPVLAAPGTSIALSAVGAWANGRDVLLALDCDAAGRKAIASVANALFRHGARRVRQVVWPGGAKDACDVVMQREIAGLYEFLKSQLVEVAP